MSGENHFEIYPERDTTLDPKPTGQYRWRFQSANGEIVAASGDGFETPSHANQAIHDFMSAINRDHPHPPIIETEE